MSSAMERRRVAITGLGLVCPLGTGVEKAWRALIQGQSGIVPITQFDATSFPTRFAGEVRDFVAEDYLDKREIRRNDRFIHFALAAGQMAIEDSGIDLTKEDPTRAGVIVG